MGKHEYAPRKTKSRRTVESSLVGREREGVEGKVSLLIPGTGFQKHVGGCTLLNKCSITNT